MTALACAARGAAEAAALPARAGHGRRPGRTA